MSELIFEFAVDVHCCPSMQCTKEIKDLLTAAKNKLMVLIELQKLIWENFSFFL